MCACWYFELRKRFLLVRQLEITKIHEITKKKGQFQFNKKKNTH